MRALVTGGCGFIGRHVVSALVAAGHEVAVLDPADGGGLPAGVTHHRASILDDTALREAVAGADWVFHLAALAQLWIPDKRDYERVNADGTRRVLAAARAAGASRIVHTSSDAVVSRGGPPAVDEQPGAYSRSKCAAELYALDAVRDGAPVIIVGPTLPLGPGDTALTPPTRMLLDFLAGRHPAYVDCVLDLVDVRDVAIAHVLAAERGTVGARYVLGGHRIAMADLLAQLHDITGAPMPRRKLPYALAWSVAAVAELVADRITHRAPLASWNGVRLLRRASSPSRDARTELGWNVRPLRETLADAIADLRARSLCGSMATPASRSA